LSSSIANSTLGRVFSAVTWVTSPCFARGVDAPALDWQPAVMKTVLETLKAVPFLHELPESTLVEVARRCVETVRLRGEVIFLEGDSPKGLLVVREGAVKIYKTGDGGREQILEIEGPGHSVAELPLFDGRPYPAACAAVHDSVLLTIRPKDFQELLVRHPDLAQAVIASLAFRLRRMVMLVQELSLRDVRQRLLDLFRELAGDGASFELDLSHQELAARIGTVREMVSRTLAKLVEDTVLRIDGKTVTLLEPTRRRPPSP
jgi:CRP/FNR family cyclic AMP-dependent transcriptional regulator